MALCALAARVRQATCSCVCSVCLCTVCLYAVRLCSVSLCAVRLCIIFLFAVRPIESCREGDRGCSVRTRGARPSGDVFLCMFRLFMRRLFTCRLVMYRPCMYRPLICCPLMCRESCGEGGRGGSVRTRGARPSGDVFLFWWWRIGR